jgi:Ca2+-transporting ATPase
MIIGITIAVTSLLLFIPIFSKFFLFEIVDYSQIGLSILIALISVMWIEIYKIFKRKITKK